MVARLSKVTEQTNGVIWSLNGSQQERGRNCEGCGTAHPKEELSPQHSVPSTIPTDNCCPTNWQKSDWVNFFTSHVQCWRLLTSSKSLCWVPEVPRVMCKGFGDSRSLARKGDEACKALGSFRNSPCNATIQLGAGCTPLANLKSFLGEWGKHWSHLFPFSLNGNTTRAALTTCSSQLMILLRMFSENLVLYYLGAANCENVWIYSYIKHGCPQCSSQMSVSRLQAAAGRYSQALRAVDAQHQPWLHAEATCTCPQLQLKHPSCSAFLSKTESGCHFQLPVSVPSQPTYWQLWQVLSLL